MNPKLEKFLYLAEEQYLQGGELEDYRAYLKTLAAKMMVYESLRDNELHLFKILADDLQAQYPDERSALLCEALSQWSQILKCCATAMLLDNPDYLAERIDNWFRELIQLRSIPKMDELLYTGFIEILPEVMSADQVALIKPYLEIVNPSSMLGSESPALIGMR